MKMLKKRLENASCDADIHWLDGLRGELGLDKITEPWYDRVKQILKTHACGWYYRVLEEGEAAAGDAIERVGRGHEEWSVAQVFAALFDPAASTMPDDLRAIVGLERLCPQWREKARELLEV